MKILVLGGTRYFGKRLIHQLLKEKHQVTILSRGQVADDFGDQVQRLIADRTKKDSFAAAVGSNSYDVVVDQICMTAQDAQVSIEVLSGKIGYYVMTSTLSVYPWGANLKESVVQPQNYKAQPITNPREAYAEGKRAAENYFVTHTGFPVGFVRIPIVLGEDDYTLRLSSQIQRIKNERPLVFQNLDAKMGYIHAEDAAGALHWMLNGKKAGPYNFATADVISMRDLVSMIEATVGKKALLPHESSDPEAQSPFGVPEDWYMNVEKAKLEGFECQRLSVWLNDLIRKLQNN